MKFIYVEAFYTGTVKLPADFIKKLPKTIALFGAIQFLRSLDDVKKQLEKAGKKVLILKTRHTRHAGQLLGCNIDTFTENFDAALYIGDGLFHPTALLLRNERSVWIYDPKSGDARELTQSEVETIKRKHKGALTRFLASTRIGVLVSTKPGQQYLKKALELEQRFPEKKFYYLVFNTIEWDQLENFPFVQMYINSTCARIGFDDTNKLTKPVLNLEDALLAGAPT